MSRSSWQLCSNAWTGADRRQVSDKQTVSTTLDVACHNLAFLNDIYYQQGPSSDP